MGKLHFGCKAYHSGELWINLDRLGNFTYAKISTYNVLVFVPHHQDKISLEEAGDTPAT